MMQPASKLTVDELIAGKTVHLTQFGRSMHELGIALIFAKRPQAKGRFGMYIFFLILSYHTRKWKSRFLYATPLFI